MRNPLREGLRALYAVWWIDRIEETMYFRAEEGVREVLREGNYVEEGLGRSGRGRWRLSIRWVKSP